MLLNRAGDVPAADRLSQTYRKSYRNFSRVVVRFFSVVELTNKFPVAVRLFSNRSQMRSKYGKNKKVAHEAQLCLAKNCDWFKFKIQKKNFESRAVVICVCPLIDHRREPIRMREKLGLLYKSL